MGMAIPPADEGNLALPIEEGREERPYAGAKQSDRALANNEVKKF